MKTLTFFLITLSLYAKGQAVQNFTLKDVRTGIDIALQNYAAAPGVMIIFTSNACAFDQYYTGRIQALARQCEDKIPVLLINSHVDERESPREMVTFVSSAGVTLPYLADKDQKVMQQLGATRSPHAFLLKNTSGKFSVVYSGAIDDNAQVEGDVKQSYLKNAAISLLAGQKITVAEARPVGCTIRRN
jgi:peroxiredoxin